MLDVCLLGTGGMMPLHYRYLTSLLLRYNGSTLMIDCGEGTQMALRKAGFSPNPIDVICFTHYHGDHISGLPGILLSMGNAERTEPLTLIGPKGLERVVNMLRVIAPELPFPVIYEEFGGTQADYFLNGYRIHAFRVQHNVPCYAYTVSIERKGRFDADRAKALGIPLKFWNRLQHGETMEKDGIVYTPDMVMGPDRKGLKVLYVTDTRPTPGIVEQAKGADLMICEGMYGDPEKLGHVKDFKHMLMQEGAEMARRAGVSELWFTHYSPAMNNPQEYLPVLREIFPNTVVPRDGYRKELVFEEDEAPSA
ncbi:MAG: ribonuclease Z [Lachnospiraceae bacterium]|nr:ribonuclease Z [Lachnospiraceae bacterium]